MNRDEGPEQDRARDSQETAVGACDKTDLEVPRADVSTSFYDDWFFDDGARS